MKKIYSLALAFVATVTMVGCSASTAAPVVEVKKVVKPAAIQSVQVFEADNTDGKITPKVISDTMHEIGLSSAGNNDMNKPFSQRFPKIHYKTYNLAMFQNDALTLNLIKKYPNFGALAPLTMSIWSDDEKHTMKVATLTKEGIARAAGIPLTDPDLIAYSALIEKGLRAAMPNGKFLELNFTVKEPTNSFAINFTADVEIEEDGDINEFREEFESGFEGEMEPIGFLMPNYSNLNEELFEKAGYDEYDFYVTYSICKFDVIYPVSRLHPEAGAYAPCSMFLYKKKAEDQMHIGYLGVKNWITTLDIEDQESIQPLLEAQGMINDILTEMTE
jgi:uncharacterized protein (DUF302 family)